MNNRVKCVLATAGLAVALVGTGAGVASANVTAANDTSPHDSHAIVLNPGQEAYMPSWWLGGTRLCMENLSSGSASVEVYSGSAHWGHVWNAGDPAEACWTTSFFGLRPDVVNHSETPGTQIAVYEPDGPSPVRS